MIDNRARQFLVQRKLNKDLVESLKGMFVKQTPDNGHLLKDMVEDQNTSTSLLAINLSLMENLLDAISEVCETEKKILATLEEIRDKDTK